MFSWALLLVLGIFLGWSVWLRACRCRSTVKNLETKQSPLSIAVQEMIATAGGIYLSLIMVVSFLKLDIPDKVNMTSISFDPLAFVAIVLAIIQPLFFNLLK